MDSQKQNSIEKYVAQSGHTQETRSLKIALCGFRRLHAAGMARLVREMDRPVDIHSEEQTRVLPDADLVVINLQRDTLVHFRKLLTYPPPNRGTPVLALYDSSSDTLANSLLQSTNQVRGILPANASVSTLLLTISALLQGRTVDPVNACVRATKPLAQTNSRQASVVDATGKAIKLTPRQMQVLESLAQGKPNKIIARDLKVSENTIKAHLKSVFRILGASNRTEAVAHASRLNLEIN